MNKRSLKEFAVYARNELRRQIGLRAQTFGITPEGSVPDLTEGTDYIEVNGIKYAKKLKQAFNQLFSETEQKGYNQLLEEAAYTWFNRLIALRYMEVHRYLPSRIRVLSSETKGKIDPDILTEYRYADLPVNEEEIAELLLHGKRDEVFKKLLVAQCNALNDIMPFLFEKLEDYTELLLPDNLLHADSVINRLVNDLEEEDFEHVEVIGWLYQYYISEKKDEVFAGLKKNEKITKENIPAATQLFTPHWIVRYMVENSLGHMWLESHNGSNLKEHMKYYIDPANQEEEVKAKLDKLKNPNLSPEDITILDPACGSGHILVYAFDLFYKIYVEQGYPSREIPRLILEKNLYGIDIDDRAVQLASFSLLMKAREKTKYIFRSSPSLNVISIQESNDLNLDFLDQLEDLNEDNTNQIRNLVNLFSDAKNYGAILRTVDIDIQNLNSILRKINLNQYDMLFSYQTRITLSKLQRLIYQADILSKRFHVVVTNPPYMGSNGMNKNLNKFTKENFPHTKGDISTVFMERSFDYALEDGYIAMINIPSWMFLSTYTNLRKELIYNKRINSLLHLGRGIFGSDFGTVSFVLQNSYIKNIKGVYKKLFDKQGAVDSLNVKEQRFWNTKEIFVRNQALFTSIPGLPIAYWTSETVRDIFGNYNFLEEYAEPRVGMATANNDRFLRLWHEVSICNVGFNINSREEAINSKLKWFPITKGGPYKKWYGNNDYLVNWKNDGEEIRNFRGSNGKVRSHNYNLDYIFKEGLTWTVISSSKTSFRYCKNGFLYSNSGYGLFVKSDINIKFILGFLNSKISYNLLKILSPTVGFESGYIRRMPLSLANEEIKNYIINKVNSCIEISKQDWDSYEVSWDFKSHPLMINNQSNKLSDAFKQWTEIKDQLLSKLKKTEEDINSAFIEIYNLEDEITKEVIEDDITIRSSNRELEAKSFLSYIVGILMGRYSVDKEGVVYAGGKWDDAKYLSFQPAHKGIIPLTNLSYFEDDIILRLEELLKIIYGENIVQENMYWLAESLGMKADETPTERLRRYFLEEFYGDHCKTYQKRPIYWMAESGKKKGFRALFYLHRYTPETLATMRFSYVQNLQEKLRQEEKRLEDVLTNPDLSSTERKRTEKQIQTIRAQQEELVEFDKVLAEYANQRIELDLDDGVVENYKKLGKVVAPIK